MNKNLKKALYLGGTTVAIGAIGASVTLPFLLREETFDFDYSPEKDLITGGINDISGEDLESDVSDDGFEDTRISSSVEYQAAFFLYDFEQTASLNLQEAHFQMDIVNKMLDIQLEMDGRNDEATIDDLKNDLIEITDKLELVRNTIGETGDQIDYDHYRFATEYPYILQQEDSIRETQDKVFQDYKNNFIKGFPTEEDGLSAWPAERSSKYNSSETDAEAVDYLVYRQISNDAVAQFRFKVNDAYRVKDYYAKSIDIDLDHDVVVDDKSTVDTWLAKSLDFSNTPGENRDDFIFSFLNGAVVSSDYAGIADDLDSKRDDKIYFLGNDSKDIEKMNLSGSNLDELTDALLADNELYDVSHVLINAKPNVAGHTLPWEIDSEQVKKLYSFIGVNADRPYNWLTDIFQEDPADLVEGSTTDMFIRYASGNSAGTIDKQGALGIKPADEFVSTMVNGFGLGMIPAYLNDIGETIPPQDAGIASNVLDELKARLIAAETNFFGATLTSQEQLTQMLALKTPEEITNEFGTIFREVFDPTGDGVDLYFPVSNDVEVVVSDDHGVHVTKTNLIDDKDSLQALITSDLEEIALKQDTTAAKVEFATLYSDHFSTDKQIEFIDNSFNGTTVEDSFREFYIENALTPIGTDPDHQADYDRMLRMIASSSRRQASTDARTATDSKIDWYKGAIDSKLRTITQLPLEEIYNWTYKMSGGQ